MEFKKLDLGSLLVNRANDRHGELENETAAIAWLFNNHEYHMRALAKDIAKSGQIFELSLVSPDGANFVVFDGNRRVTCLKMLVQPNRAPSTELQEFFRDLSTGAVSSLPKLIDCQIVKDRDQIDEILFRRHTGSQGGVGQAGWDDRMKSNFINRTGKGGTLNVANEVEARLSGTTLPSVRKKIPWSTMNRLLSAEAFRNRVGFSVAKGKFEYTHQESKVLSALHRIADDLANKRIVLGDLWDVDGKRAYLDKLDSEGVLPHVGQAIPPTASPPPTKPSAPKPPPPSKLHRRTTLIPDTYFPVAWAGRLQRHHAIWDELQFRLRLTDHPNAISVLFRVLLELSIDNYINQTSLPSKPNDSLARKALLIASDLHAKDKIDSKYLDLFQKFPQYDKLVSADTLNRYVHSSNFAPSPEHLTALWDSLADFIVHCLNA